MNSLNEIFQKYITAQKAGDTSVLISLFRDIIISRNDLAKSQGYSDYVDMSVKKIHQVPETGWLKYQKNNNIFANEYSARVISSENLPHFLSSLSDIGMKFPTDVMNFVANKYPEIDKVKDKISIENSDNKAHFQYSKEKGTYSIFIPETNPNQKISMLIHELAHVISQEKLNHQVEGIYSSEFEAHKIEFDLARDISQNFFHAVVGEYLICLVRTDFQIKMFEKPELDPIDTYTNSFAKYIGRLNEKNQEDFLFDKKITHDPLVDLADAVSIVNLLT